MKTSDVPGRAFGLGTTRTEQWPVSFPGEGPKEDRPVAQSCPTLCDPMDCRPSVHVIFQARILSSVQFSSVAQSCPTLCNSMNHRTPGFPVHHQLPEFIQTHVRGLLFPLPGIFPTHGSNPHLLDWQADSLLLSHPGSPLKRLA